jgi:hypothetical protein
MLTRRLLSSRVQMISVHKKDNLPCGTLPSFAADPETLLQNSFFTAYKPLLFAFESAYPSCWFPH